MRARRWAGALVAATLAAAAAAGCARGGGYQVTAVFDDVGDLVVNHSVQVADVRVGRVSGIALTDDYRAEVTMTIDDDVQVPRRSRALLRTTSLLGEKFVELRPVGDAAAGPFLADGDRLADTGEAPELEFVAAEAIEVLGAVTAGDVATLVETGAEGLAGRGAELRSLIEDLATISAAFASRTEQLTAVVDGLEGATGSLAGGAPHVDALLVNLAETTRVLAANRDRAVAALDQLARLARSQNVVLDRYAAEIDRQVKQVDAVLDRVAESSGELGAFVDWLTRMVTGVPGNLEGDFIEVYMWFVPCEQDPRSESCE